MLKNWKTTLSVLAYDVFDTLHALPDFSAMTWKEIALRGAKITAITLVGLFAADGKKETPNDVVKS